MRAGAVGSGTTGSVNRWSRVLGVTLRPWSGQAPWRLLLSGTIQAVVCVAFLIYVSPMAEAYQTDAALAAIDLHRIVWMVSVIFIVLLLIGVAKIIIGALDLIPRVEVTGQVLSMRDRKFADFLPQFVHSALQARRSGNTHVTDNRKVRHEVVVQTPQGVRQWTVRSYRLRNELTVGSHVRMVTTPLLGHITKVERLSR